MDDNLKKILHHIGIRSVNNQHVDQALEKSKKKLDKIMLKSLKKKL